MTTPEPHSIVLVGGPRDGETLTYDYQPYYIHTDGHPEYVYELDFNGYLPALDRHGHYRYRYRGTQ